MSVQHRAAWVAGIESFRGRKPDVWTYAGSVRLRLALDTGAVRMGSERCPHRHRSAVLARRCADKIAARIGWAHPACADCGTVFDGPRHDALRRGWGRTKPLDGGLDESDLMCPSCIRALLDQVTEGLRAVRVQL